MSATHFEVVLAKLYTDTSFRTRFLDDPNQALEYENLTTEEKDALEKIDRAGLVMAAHSFLHKRSKKTHRAPLAQFLRRIFS